MMYRHGKNLNDFMAKFTFWYSIYAVLLFPLLHLSGRWNVKNLSKNAHSFYSDDMFAWICCLSIGIMTLQSVLFLIAMRNEFAQFLCILSSHPEVHPEKYRDSHKHIPVRTIGV